jgi:hypothetical protein
MNDRLPGTREQLIPLIVFGILTGTCSWTLLDGRIGGGAAPWIWMVVMGCLLFRLPLTIYVVTTLVLVMPVLGGFPRFRRLATEPALDDVLFALVLAGFVYFGFRLVDALNDLRRVPPPAGSAVITARGTGGNDWQLTGAWLVPIAVLLATGVLILIPENPDSRQLIRLTPAGLRTVTLIWLTGLFWLTAHSAFGLLGRRRMTRDQAALYVRSCLAREVRREMARIERSRARQLGRTGPGL